MKKLNFKILFVALLSIIVTSCENYLDPGYDEFLDKEEVFSSYDYSLKYVRTVYSYLPGTDFSEAFMSDEAKNTDTKSSYVEMNNGAWNSRNYVGSWTWSHYYAGIRRAHIFLENVDSAIFVTDNTLKLTPELNDTLRKQYKGEIRFLRAFFYFELLKRFGDPTRNLGVPILPDNLLSNDSTDYKRSTYDECVNQILIDCNAAEKVLPVRWYSSDYGRVSKAAILALKSRLLLYVASPLANPTNDIEKWKTAAEAAKKIIDLKVYKLIDKSTVQADNMLSIFTKPNNDEVIFCNQVEQSNSFEKNNLPPSFGGSGQTNPTQNLVDAFETILGYPITDSKSGYKPNEPYYRRDKRLDYFIGLNGATINSTGKIESYVGGKDGFNIALTSTKTGYYIRKFIDPNADIIKNRTIATHFWVYFRYAEILLNYAEAMANAYGVSSVPAGYSLSAYDALKLIRDRVGLTTPAIVKTLPVNEFLERIKNERRVELCFEGHRFWDVRRWKQGDLYFNGTIKGMKITKAVTTGYLYDIIDVENRVFENKMYIMPIPYDEVQKSKLLEQNTSW